MPEAGRPGSLSSRLSTSARLLVVEDDDDIADFLRAFFRASGYDLVRIDPSKPSEVVDAIDEYSPECVLLDYCLRGFSGNDAYRMIRSHDRLAFLPVIVVSADARARHAAAEQATGVDGFVAKPFNVNALADLVSARIEASHELAQIGRDETFAVMTQRYMSARLADELTIARQNGRALAFALIRVTGPDDAVRRMIDLMRSSLSDDAVLGRTDSEELAVLVPDIAAPDLEPMLDRAIGEARPVKASAGIAGYPDHAHDPDELFMAADSALAEAIDRNAPVRLAI